MFCYKKRNYFQRNYIFFSVGKIRVKYNQFDLINYFIFFYDYDIMTYKFLPCDQMSCLFEWAQALKKQQQQVKVTHTFIYLVLHF